MGSKLRSWWQKTKQHPFIATGIIVVLFVLIAFTIALYKFGWDWIGFNGGYSKVTITNTPQGTTTATEKPLGKTFWDLLQLLIVPIMLAIGGFWLNQIQKNREEKTTKQRAEDEQKIATDNQREAALQAYIDKISELLLHENLRESKPEDEVRKIARVRTLTVLPRLDANRKKSVLQFLYESSLIAKDKSIIDLDGADLRGADLGRIHLDGADLRGADLQGANLYGADLRTTSLRNAYLRDANLGAAKLQGADLRDAHLDDTFLGNADLRDADMSGAELFGSRFTDKLLRANLKGTKMHNILLLAHFTDMDTDDIDSQLRWLQSHGADLGETTVRAQQSDETKLPEGRAMPDGSAHP